MKILYIWLRRVGNEPTTYFKRLSFYFMEWMEEIIDLFILCIATQSQHHMTR